MKIGQLNKNYIDLLLESINDVGLLDDFDESFENGIQYLEMAADGQADELVDDSVVHALNTYRKMLLLIKKLQSTKAIDILKAKLQTISK